MVGDFYSGYISFFFFVDSLMGNRNRTYSLAESLVCFALGHTMTKTVWRIFSFEVCFPISYQSRTPFELMVLPRVD